LVFLVRTLALLLLNITRQRLEKVLVTRRRIVDDLKQPQSLPTCQGYCHLTLFIRRCCAAECLAHLTKGNEHLRQWRKVHLGVDAQTLEIRAIEVTDNGVGDAPMLPHLLAQIPTDETLASVSADGAYDTKACHTAIAERGAQAIIPPRKNAQVWKDTSAGAQVRNQAVRACKRLGSRIWKKWSGYHRRSLVETKMHCFKRLGERVMARTFERQVTELHIRVALLNRFTRLGCPVTVSVA